MSLYLCPECEDGFLFPNGDGWYTCDDNFCDYTIPKTELEDYGDDDDTQPILTSDWGLDMQYEDRYSDGE